MDITQRLKVLEQSSNIIPSRDKRVVTNAMALAFHAKTRIGYWWYHPDSGQLKFSTTARSHFRLNEFGMTGGLPVGWVRGAVFEMEGGYYLLIQVCDFLSTPLSGKILNDIYQKAQGACQKEIMDIVTEEGFSLL